MTKGIDNLNFWKGILRDNKIQPFIDRGNKKQKSNITKVLKYLKRADLEFFEEVHGKQILKELKNG